MKPKRLSWLVISLSLVLALAVALAAGCAPAAPVPTPTPTGKPTMEPQVWDFWKIGTGPGMWDSEILQMALDNIYERTDGALKINQVWAGSVPIVAKDVILAVSEGQFAGCQTCAGYSAGVFPFYAVLDVPYLFTSKYEKALVQNVAQPIFEREFNKDNLHVICEVWASGDGLLMRVPVDNIMDLKGLTVRSYSKAVSRMIEALGGVAVTIAWAEVYTGLQRGTFDGLHTSYDAYAKYSFHEIAPYMYETGFLACLEHYIMNKELYDSLPDWVQEIFDEEMYYQERLLAAAADEETKKGIDMMVAEGLQFDSTWPLDEFFTLMNEEVTKPLLKEEVELAGPIGLELVAAVEKALGRKLLD